MNRDELFSFYEKLYFHETESKNQISNRLQITLAILVSYASVYAYFLKQTEFKLTFWCLLFIATTAASILIFCVSIYFFKCAFLGHTYEMLPTAKETEEYRQLLITTYQGYQDSEKLVSNYLKEYIFNYYNECSSINTRVNDFRSHSLHYANKFILYNLFALTLAFFIFCLAGLDKDTTNKQIDVKITNPIQLK